MGFLTFFNKAEPKILRLPSGSFTVDRNGYILARTLGSDYPDELVAEVARQVLESFQKAAAAQLQLSELTIYYKSLKINARELRGGALVFFTPTTTFTNN